MLKSFRNLSQSKLGGFIAVLFLLAIVASFALADISNVLSGGSFGTSQSELAKVGSEAITDREMDEAMQRRLTEVRQQNPEADYSAILGDFDAILNGLIDERALHAFARKHGFNLSKRLIDAEIANIPGARDLSGRFSEQAYAAWLQQQQLTDGEVRRLIASSMLQRLMLAPVVANSRAPVGMARPYASMLLEMREGQVAFVPVDAFREGLNPTSAHVEQFYRSNQSRYTVPEQRVLRIARIGPEQVSTVAATDQEIANYYRQNQARYAARDTRTINQVVVPDQATAQQIAARARGGQGLAAAAAPAGANAAVSTLDQQNRQQYAGIAGAQAAEAVFAADQGAIVGPVQSDFGWVVARVDAIQSEGGQSLAEARNQIAGEINANKRKEALTDLVTRVEDAIADGASFAEATQSARLEVIQTPLITASGQARGESGYTFPQELAPALSAGFELAEGDDPVVETLPDDAGYVLVAPERIVPAAPAPLAAIRDQVAKDWITAQAAQRARAAAEAINQRAASAPLPDAVRAAQVQIPAVEPVRMRRLALSQFQGQVPPALGVLFSLSEGKARMVAGTQGEGFYVVKVNEITPGNASLQPALIGQTQQQMGEALSQEYARQFLLAIKRDVGVSLNQDAIEAAKRRIAGGS